MNNIRNFNRNEENELSYSTDSLNLFFYDLPKDFNDEYKSYDRPRLCTILEGRKEVRINCAEHFVYQKDKFLLLPPHSTVNMYISEHTRALVYEFNDHIIDKVSQKVFENIELNVSNNISYSTFKLEHITKRIEQLHQRTRQIVTSDDVNMDFLLDLTAQEVVYELIKIKGCYEIIHHHKHHPINKAIRLMNSNQSELMTISQIAEEVNMSLANFSQKFRAITDLRPKEYLTKLRMKKSKRFLQNLSVTDTAYEIGYDNISHFIRLFKNEYGVTPKQYQLRNTDYKHH